MLERICVKVWAPLGVCTCANAYGGQKRELGSLQPQDLSVDN